MTDFCFLAPRRRSSCFELLHDAQRLPKSPNRASDASNSGLVAPDPGSRCFSSPEPTSWVRVTSPPARSAPATPSTIEAALPLRASSAPSTGPDRCPDWLGPKRTMSWSPRWWSTPLPAKRDWASVGSCRGTFRSPRGAPVERVHAQVLAEGGEAARFWGQLGFQACGRRAFELRGPALRALTKPSPTLSAPSSPSASPYCDGH